MLSSELSTLLTGRYIEIEIYPLSYSEYRDFSKGESSRELFLEYLKFGGLPGIFGLRRDEKMIFEYLR
jgi:predicted AAA+ superfamily ATPase